MAAWLLQLLFIITPAHADFVVPPLSGPVVDQAGILASSTVEGLGGFLRQLAEQGGAQVEVATVKDLGGLSIEEASIKITDQWKLGKRKEDRGVLLLIAQAEHKVRIEVGQGLEGDLPDITASHIINDVIVPRMHEGSPDRAVIDGVSAIVQHTDPKLLAEIQNGLPASSSRTIHKSGFGRIFTLLFWLVILIIFLRPGGRGGMGAIGYLLLGGLGGGGSSGGSSGGGWSGGGGGFSGGGSSGGW